MPRSLMLLICLAAATLGLAACKRENKAEAPQPRPVRAVIAAPQKSGETVVLTGHIEAQDEVPLAFRIGGRMVERNVRVGDQVKAGQLLAKLDAEDEVNGLRSAQAGLAAAQAAVTQTRAAFERQRTLLAQGHTPRAQFDLAEKALQTAQAQADDAEARVNTAGRRVSFALLTADGDGTVTAVGAEPGEVVQAGQRIVQLARQGGRDAVFDVPAQVLRDSPPDPEVMLTLADNPQVTATGRVREVSPQADPVTRTFRVRVGLADPPAAMLLGATVNGRVQLDAASAITLPASALTQSGNAPAVWIVDPAKHTVSMRNIDVARFDPGSVVVAHGLDTGDIVVTAGVQALHPGQEVRLLGPAS